MIPLPIAVIAALLFAAVGQLFLKVGVTHIRADRSASLLLAATHSPYVLLGLALTVIATGFWLLILNSLPLVIAYPMLAMNYVLVSLLASVLLHERIAPVNIVGIGLVVMGVILLFRK